MIILREGAAGDHALVLGTWLRHYRRRSAMMRLVPERVYDVEQSELIKALLPRAELVCAVDSSAPEIVIGYLVHEPSSVHWIHVKGGFRLHGIARLMLGRASGAVWYTHDADNAVAVARRCGLSVRYNPFRAWAL